MNQNGYNLEQFQHESNCEILNIRKGGNILSRLLAFTSASYDVTTGEIDGRLINHSQLINNIGLSNLPYNSYVSFSVDISSKNSNKTELITSGRSSDDSILVPYLVRLFEVGMVNTSNNIESD